MNLSLFQRTVCVGIALALAGCQSDSSTNPSSSTPATGSLIGASQASPASCDTGSRPEPSIQGQVPLADRQSGRSQQGYTCNMQLLGQYQGEGTTWVNPSYADCAYMGTTFTGIPTKKSQGVQVVDARNPAKPVLSTNLASPAFLLSTWESLKVNEKRGLLAGVAVGPILLWECPQAQAGC